MCYSLKQAGVEKCVISRDSNISSSIYNDFIKEEKLMNNFHYQENLGCLQGRKNGQLGALVNPLQESLGIMVNWKLKCPGPKNSQGRTK